MRGAGKKRQERRRIQGRPVGQRQRLRIVLAEHPEPRLDRRRHVVEEKAGQTGVAVPSPRIKRHWTAIKPGGCVPMCSESWPRIHWG